MGRGKLPLRVIEKERARRITCTKRKKGLLKKAKELSTLCDIRVCVIVHDSEAADGNCLRTFPENPRDVKQIVSDYYATKAKSPTNTKRDLTLVDFFNDRIRKLRGETEKMARESLGVPVWDSRIEGFTRDQLYDLMARLDSKIEEVTKLKAEKNRSANVERIECREAQEKSDKSMMAIGGSHGQVQAWFHHHQPSSSSNANANDNDMVISSGFDQMMAFEPSPWSVMNNLPYYARLLDAPDMCDLGMGSESSSAIVSCNNNGASVQSAVLQPYPNVLYGPSPGLMQYFLGPGQFYHGSAAVYQFGSVNEHVGVSQEDLKFHGKMNHFGFGKPSGV